MTAPVAERTAPTIPVEIIKTLLGRPIAFHRAFVTIGGGVSAGLMLSQAWYWSQRTNDPAGWFWKTQEDWEKETGLTRREQETARRQLMQRGLMEEELRGVPARLHFRLDIQAISNAIGIAAQNNAAQSCA